MFLIYLLLHRLEHQLPTAIQVDPGRYFVFNQDGPAEYFTTEIAPGLKECWALVDSNEHVLQPCPAFTIRAGRVIQTSSPLPDRWKSWIKHASGGIIIADLPTVPEIAAVV